MSIAIYDALKKALETKILSHDLSEKPVNITCRALSAKQAIGTPDHDDYPIIKGKEAIKWCTMIFATGSTIVNNTLSTFMAAGKPAIFYGVTICAPARILNLTTFCEYGH